MSDNSILGKLLLQLFLIILNALFAAAEIAVISMNDAKMEKLAAEGDKRAKRLSRLTDQPARFLATIQVGITLAGFLGSAFAADNFSDKIVHWLTGIGVRIPAATLDTISVVVITLILSYFTLVLGELVPKRLAMKNAEKLALGMSGLVCFISRVFSPVVSLLTASTNGMLRLLGIDPTSVDEQITEEEIRMMVDEGSKKGAINHSEKEMIQNVFEFDDKTAEEVMTHRTEVSLLWLEESDEQWEKTIIESRHTNYPVCDETTDDIIGVLNTKDYFRLKDKSRENVMKHAVRPPYFVPESVRADVLFRNMKQSRNHFAIVLDEYGGMSGIITIKDLLELIVGDFDDETPPEEPKLLIERVDSHTWKINGLTSLKSVSEALNVSLPDDEYETFSGFVFGILGYIPEDGSTPEVEGYGLNIKVLQIREHQLEKAIVYVHPRDDAPEEKTKE
ncbi:MAG: HlyC/CorC family transporter [Clostridiaceae bacterium]|nr:HlyC/CorC family transporter [Clostridiaceae bacterium]